MITGVPWVVYATAALTQAVAAPMEEEREEHEERDARELAEQAAPPPPARTVTDLRRESAIARAASHAAMRPPTPACPTVRHPSKFSVRRLI